MVSALRLIPGVSGALFTLLFTPFAALAQPVCQSEGAEDAEWLFYPRRDGTDEEMRMPLSDAALTIDETEIRAAGTCARGKFQTQAGPYMLSGENGGRIARVAAPSAQSDAPTYYLMPVSHPRLGQLQALTVFEPGDRHFVLGFFSKIPEDALLTEMVQASFDYGSWVLSFAPGDSHMFDWIPGGQPAPRPGETDEPGQSVLVSTQTPQHFESTATGILHTPSGVECPRTLPNSRVRLWDVNLIRTRITCRYSVMDSAGDFISLAFEQLPGADPTLDFEYFVEDWSAAAERVPSPLGDVLPEDALVAFFDDGGVIFGVAYAMRGEWMVSLSVNFREDADDGFDMLRSMAALYRHAVARP